MDTARAVTGSCTPSRCARCSAASIGARCRVGRARAVGELRRSPSPRPTCPCARDSRSSCSTASFRRARTPGASSRGAPARACITVDARARRELDRRAPRRAATGDVALVATPVCHWTDGTLIDLERLAPPCARSVPRSSSMRARRRARIRSTSRGSQPDFLCAVGYKWLMGPYSLGYLYVAPKWHERGVPIEQTWMSRAGAEDFTRLVDYIDELRPARAGSTWASSRSSPCSRCRRRRSTQVLDVGSAAHRARRRCAHVAHRARRRRAGLRGAADAGRACGTCSA